MAHSANDLYIEIPQENQMRVRLQTDVLSRYNSLPSKNWSLTDFMELPKDTNTTVWDRYILQWLQNISSQNSQEKNVTPFLKTVLKYFRARSHEDESLDEQLMLILQNRIVILSDILQTYTKVNSRKRKDNEAQQEVGNAKILAGIETYFNA